MTRERILFLVRILPLAIESSVGCGEKVAEFLMSYGRSIDVTREEAERVATATPQQLADLIAAAPLNQQPSA